MSRVGKILIWERSREHDEFLQLIMIKTVIIIVVFNFNYLMIKTKFINTLLLQEFRKARMIFLS